MHCHQSVAQLHSLSPYSRITRLWHFCMSSVRRVDSQFRGKTPPTSTSNRIRATIKYFCLLSPTFDMVYSVSSIRENSLSPHKYWELHTSLSNNSVWANITLLLILFQPDNHLTHISILLLFFNWPIQLTETQISSTFLTVKFRLFTNCQTDPPQLFSFSCLHLKLRRIREEGTKYRERRFLRTIATAATGDGRDRPTDRTQLTEPHKLS